MALKYIVGQDALVADFIVRSKRASGYGEHADFSGHKYKAIGVANADNELIAGFAYYNYNPTAGTIEMSIEALPGHRWLTPMTIGVMFRYPFIGCGCQMVSTKAMAHSEHILRMLAAANFTLIRIPRACGRHEDGVIAVLTDDDWRDNKFCQRYKHHLIGDGTIDADADAKAA